MTDKYIKSPSNVLQSDVEYAFDLYMKGIIDLSDLITTNQGTLQGIATKEEIKTFLNNSAEVRIKAEDTNTEQQIIINQCIKLYKALNNETK